MQTYTHFAIGTSTGALLFPGNPATQIACAIGAIAPDLILVPKFALDKLQSKQAFVEQSAGLLLAKEIANSIPYAIVGCLMGWLLLFVLQPKLSVACLLLAFFVGYTEHLIIDAPTHNGKEYQDTDPSYLYFWPFWVPKIKLGDAIRNWGFGWEYRRAHGDLKPKWQETIVFFALAIPSGYIWLPRLYNWTVKLWACLKYHLA